MDRDQFLKTLNLIKTTAKENNNAINKSILEEVLSDLNLDKEQHQLVLEFLNNSKIKIYDKDFEEVKTDFLVESEEISNEDLTGYEEKEESWTDEETSADAIKEVPNGDKAGEADEAADDENSNSHIGLYKEEVNALSQLNDEEKQVLYQKAMNGDKDAKETIVCQYLNQVMEMAKLYEGQGVLYEDLVQEGNIGLIMGLDLLGCCESMEEIPGFLGKMIMDAMEASINEQSEESNFEETLLQKAEKIDKAVTKKKEELQRKIKISEVAELVEMTVDEIEEVLTLSGTHIHDIVRDNQA